MNFASSRIRLFALIFSGIFSVHLLLAHLLPANTWFSELLHLGLSVSLPLIIFFTALFTIINRKLFLLWIAPLLLATPFFQHWFAAGGISKKSASPNLKIISFNIATLDTKRFPVSLKNPETVDYRPMFEWVKQNKDADILCLQEFYDSFKPGMQSILDSVVELGGYKYYCINPFFSQESKGFFGVIIFSKKEPTHCEKLIYGHDNVFNKGLYFDFISDNDTLRILNLHLASMSIRPHVDTSHTIVLSPAYWIADTYKRLKKGYYMRTQEMESIQSFLANSPANTIVCGDFNASAHMRVHHVMRKNFHDAFLASGFGTGFSYHHFPNIIRIDYQYYKGNIEPLSCFTDKSARFSDHFPIVATYRTSKNFMEE